MKQQIENILKKNIKHCRYNCYCKLCQLCDEDTHIHCGDCVMGKPQDINTSLIADEVLKEIESILDSFCVMVKNELKQQRLDGFSLDGTDFDEVFKSAEKTILSTLSPNKENE